MLGIPITHGGNEAFGVWHFEVGEVLGAKVDQKSETAANKSVGCVFEGVQDAGGTRGRDAGGGGAGRT